MMWIPFSVEENIKITEMFSFFKVHFDNTYEFSGETHNFWECVYVIDGSICVSADNRIYNLTKGEIIFHKPLELHKFHISGDTGATLLIFSYAAEGNLCNYFCDKVFSLTDKQKQIISDLIEYASGCLSDVENTGYKMYLTPFNENHLYSQTVAVNIYRLMLSLAQSSKVLPVLKTHDSVVFRKAVGYMGDRVCDNPSVDEIAEHVNVSVSSIKRIFKRYAGMGVHKYFLKLKLKAAAELLESGFAVTFVSEKLGFSSQGYFTRTFKRELGMLPSVFNLKNRNS